ncbi:CASP-like protein 4D1 [Juglans regia]|uniref:CASP-like protein n=2 Tax=Juglans regia TaxID=51240 RepID=A0A2I4DU61_JUGRE|nr:CASP-like protein 4D1 [Juglans regia]
MADAAPGSSTTSRVVLLILRVFSFVLLLISLIVLAVNSGTMESDVGTLKIHFNDVYAYRYMLAAIVIGFAYSLMQLAFSVFRLLMANGCLGGDCGVLLDFYGDKVVSYVLATGAAAGFGVTTDLKRVFEIAGLDFGDKFYQMANASASLLFLAFVCTAICSVLSSYALPKKF